MRALIAGLLFLPLPLAAQPSTGENSKPKVFPATPERIALDPGISLRNHLMPDRSLLKEAAQFTVRCHAIGRDGRVANCDLPAGDPALAEIARKRASYYLLRVDDLLSKVGKPKSRAAFWDIGYSVDISERVSPEDYRAFNYAPDDYVRSDQLRFVKFPDTSVLIGLYPFLALRELAAARISVRCRAEADLSLFCINPQVKSTWEGMPDDVREQFANDALAISSKMRLQSTLQDGRPTAGKVFDLRIAFAIPRELMQAQ